MSAGDVDLPDAGDRYFDPTGREYVVAWVNEHGYRNCVALRLVWKNGRLDPTPRLVSPAELDDLWTDAEAHEYDAERERVRRLYPGSRQL